MSTQKDQRAKLLVVNSEPGQIKTLAQSAPSCEWIEAPAQWPFYKGEWHAPDQVDAVIVSAVNEEEDKVVMTCKEIRQRNDVAEKPLFVVITMYQMHVGNAVRRMPKAHFLIEPVEEQALMNRLEEFKAA